MGLLGSVFNGLGNLVSGGTWKQSGGEIAAQDWNSAQAAANRAFQSASTLYANTVSAREAEKVRNWQEYMRDTQYLSTAKQLQSLGINPYVMLSGFSGASTPSGAQGSAYSSSGSQASGNFSRSSSLSPSQSFSNIANSALALAKVATVLA